MLVSWEKVMACESFSSVRVNVLSIGHWYFREEVTLGLRLVPSLFEIIVPQIVL